MMISMKDVLSGSCTMRSAKYQRIVNGLQWRQRFLRSSHYELEVRYHPRQKRQEPVGDIDLVDSISETEVIPEKVTIHLKQIENGEIKGLGTGAFVWPAAHVLSKYIENQYIEGCVGIVCAALGATVTLSDQPCITFLLEENKKLFCDNAGSSFDPNDIDVQVYDWTEKPDAKMRLPFDLVLVSECVLPKLYPIDLLIEGLLKVMAPHTVTLVAYEHRPYPYFDPRLEFQRLAELQGLQIEAIPQSEHDPIYSCDDIELWKVYWANEGVKKLNFSDIVSPLQWGDSDVVTVRYQVQKQSNQESQIHESFDIPFLQRMNWTKEDQDASPQDRKDIGMKNTNQSIGSNIWSSAIVMSRLLLSKSYEDLSTFANIPRNESFQRPLRALELGAGCGVASIALVLAGYEVLSTDISGMISLLQTNIRAAIEKVQSHGEESSSHEIFNSSNIAVSELNWFKFQDENVKSDNIGNYDLVVCADCCYSSLAVVPLFNVLNQVCSDSTLIVMTNELRTSWEDFLSYSKKQTTRSIQFQTLDLSERDIQLRNNNVLLCPTRPIGTVVGKFVTRI